jgi:hypothetical protein
MEPRFIDGPETTLAGIVGCENGVEDFDIGGLWQRFMGGHEGNAPTVSRDMPTSCTWRTRAPRRCTSAWGARRSNDWGRGVGDGHALAVGESAAGAGGACRGGRQRARCG